MSEQVPRKGERIFQQDLSRIPPKTFKSMQGEVSARDTRNASWTMDRLWKFSLEILARRRFLPRMLRSLEETEARGGGEEYPSRECRKG